MDVNSTHLTFLFNGFDFFSKFSDVFIEMAAELVDVSISLRDRLVDRIPHVVNRRPQSLKP